MAGFFPGVFKPMGDLQCPVCKSNSYINPGIKLYVSPCYHKMCEACLAYTFQSGQAPCPECGSMLRKVNYMTQTFEDLSVEKECKIRKMLRKFMLEEGDFDSPEAYNDYLEAFEDKILGVLEVEDYTEVLENIKSYYRSNKRKESDLSKKPKHEKLETKTIDWFTDLVFEEFQFSMDVVMLECFKPKNTAGGCYNEVMAYKAYASLFDTLI